MKEPTKLEKVSGSLTVQAATTTIAALLGGPTAALIPVLTSTLANGRHERRVADAIKEIEARLSTVEEIQSDLTDPQYKLINEMVLSILNTPDGDKVEYLKKIAFKTPKKSALSMHESTVIARAINGISIGELSLLLECQGKGILFNRHREEGYFNIEKFSSDGECALGLINLGLLVRSSSEGLASDIGAYEFTDLAKKIIELIES